MEYKYSVNQVASSVWLMPNKARANSTITILIIWKFFLGALLRNIIFACQSEVVQETVASGMFYLRHFFPAVQFTVNTGHLHTAVQESQQGYDDQYSQIGQYFPLNESLA